MFGPGRDLKRYLTSLRALQRRVGAFDEIWPAHGPFPVEPAQIARLCLGAERVLAGQVRWEPAELRGTPLRVYDVGCAKFLMKE